MIPKPSHNRKLGLLGVALTKQRNNRYETQALTEVRDEIENALVETQYLADTPFSWVTVTVRYGLKNEDIPKYQAVNKKYGDLPLSIEVDTNDIRGASLVELKLIFRRATLKALIHAGNKFGRNTDFLENLLIALPKSV